MTGLVFVAVSINLNRIVSYPGLPGRAAESILQFLNVFFIATVALIPEQPVKDLGIELPLIGIISWLLQMRLQVTYRRRSSENPLSWFLSRVGLTQLSTLPFCVVGVQLPLGVPSALDWLVPGFLFSFCCRSDERLGAADRDRAVRGLAL